MKNIIAPVDFSPESLSAARYAVALASATGANVHLLHVCMLPLPISEIPVSQQSLEEAERDAMNQLQITRQGLQDVTGPFVNIICKVKTDTVSVLDGIIDYSEWVRPDAVVVCLHSATAFERFFFGSATLGAASRLLWPLLVVPNDKLYTDIGKIGLACDFTDLNENIPVNQIAQLTAEFHAELHVIHVSKTGTPLKTLDSTSAVKYLKKIFADLSPTYHVLCRDDVDEAITKLAETLQLDLLVVIPRQRSTLAQLFHRSHTRRIVLHGHIPVLAIHE